MINRQSNITENVHLKSFVTNISKFLKSPWGSLVKICISLLILSVFAFTVDWNEFYRLIRKVDPIWIFAILFIIVARTFISGWRFKVLSSFQSSTPTLTLTKHYFIASMFNLFLPTTIGGDGVRVLLLKKEGLQKKESVTLILVERIIGFFSFILFSLGACFFIDIPATWKLYIVIFSLSYATVVLLAIFKSDINENIPFVGKLFSSFNRIKKHKKLLFYTFVISVIFQFVSIVMRYFVAVAFGIEVPLVTFLAFIPLINIVTLLPISFGGVGLREAAFVFFFSQVGLSNEECILISLGSFLALTMTGIIGALIYLYDSFVKKEGLI